MVNKLNLVSKCEMPGLFGVFNETTEVYNDIVPFLFPSKSAQHFLSTCFINEYFARNLL